MAKKAKFNKSPNAKTKLKKSLTTNSLAHPWRLCPAGQHYQRSTSVSAYTTSAGKFVRAHKRRGSCAQNPTGHDQMYPEQVLEIAKQHFKNLGILPSLKNFVPSGDMYDQYIQGWTKYWNDILKLQEPLDPILIKALIASESRFNPNAWNKIKGPGRARGPMQVTDKTITYLSDNYNELNDHFLNFTEDDMLDPNSSIYAGVRWLFRKKELAEKKLGRKISWTDAVAEFKGVKPQSPLMKKFNSYYEELQQNENSPK
jgi:hypothetical protein